MSTKAVIQQLGALTSYRYGVDSYNSSNLGLGPNIYQQNAAGTGEGDYAGPLPITVARPFEQTTAIPSVFPHGFSWQNNSAGELDWIFLADNAAAALTRRVNAYTFNKRTALWTWKGFVTLNFPSNAGTYTIRGMRMTYDIESTGTVSVSSTGVTGTNTLFSTNKVCVGNRIGFGATSPSAISTWYYISAINPDTSITLTSGATAYNAALYCIEDLRCITLATNATAGGVCVTKGLSFDDFTSFGSNILAGATTDNLKAVYWLKDAAVITNTIGCGMGLSTRLGPTSHMLYVLDTTTNPTIFKYNIRAPLTLSSGGDTAGAFQFKTGLGGTVTGTISQANNMRLATAAHGPYSGAEALYFTTTTRIYGVPTSAVANGSTSWLSSGSVMTEVPPGGVNTFAPSALLNSIEYCNAIDKFVITTNSTTTPFRSYITQFRTDNGQLDRIWGLDNRQIDQSTADATTTPVPSMDGGPYTVYELNGVVYTATFGTTAITNRLYALPLCADWEYTGTTKSVLMMPAVSISDGTAVAAILASDNQVVGGKTGYNLGTPPEPFRLWYRTSGISDDSGSWNLLDGTGIANASLTSQVQVKAEFRTIGNTCLPSRLCTVAILYNDLGTLTNYQFSVNQSSAASKQFAYRFSTAFGATVPNLRIRLYDAVAGTLLVDDNTASPVGTFLGSTNSGATYSAWTNADKTNETTYLMYTPASLADNINVRPLLTAL